jgi:hypothetical protein
MKYEICLFTLAVSASHALLFAQHPASRWDNLESLRSGQKIQVVTSDGQSWHGAYRLVTPDAISLRVDRGLFRHQEKALPASDVVRVSGVSRLRNTLIGLGVGLGAGAAMSAWAANRIEKGYGGALTTGQATAISLTFLGGAGAGIGYAIPSRRTLYLQQAPPQSTGR